jgi:1-acyl-sn-glycerol-3-phosphate acyltransferase
MYFFYIIFSFYTLYNIFSQNISKKMLDLLGYTYNDITDLQSMPSKLIIIGSHTTVYDFVIGSLFYYAILHEKYSTYILMKKQFEQMCYPFLIFFGKKFKLIKIDSEKKGITEQICLELHNKDNFIIFIAPEGTRKLTEKLRSGYWHISKKLNIDIIYLGIDYSSRNIIMEECRKPKDTWDEEQDEFIKSCKKYVPLYPERCFQYNCASAF